MEELNHNYTETNNVLIKYEENGDKIVNHYKFIKTLGRGSYSKVKLAIDINNKNKTFAVKIVNKGILKRKKKGYGKDEEGNMTIITMLDDAVNEIKILKVLNNGSSHQNVIKLYEIINDDKADKTYIILEYCEKSSLMQFNDQTGVFSVNPNFNKNYTEKELAKIFFGLASGLIYSKKFSYYF